MINWNFEIGSSTPPKLSFEQGSTGCFKGSQGVRSEKKQERKGVRRSSRDLSSDSDEEIKNVQKSIKKFKFDADIPPFLSEDIILPF